MERMPQIEPNAHQSARHLIPDNLPPLQQGIDQQLKSLRKNVEVFVDSFNPDCKKSKVLGPLIAE